MQLSGKTFHLSTIRFANTYFLISNLLFLLNKLFQRFEQINPINPNPTLNIYADFTT